MSASFLRNFVSIDCTTPATTAKKPCRLHSKNAMQTYKNSIRLVSITPCMLLVTSRIFKKKMAELKFSVRGYGYIHAGDTWESPYQTLILYQKSLKTFRVHKLKEYLGEYTKLRREKRTRFLEIRSPWCVTTLISKSWKQKWDYSGRHTSCKFKHLVFIDWNLELKQAPSCTSIISVGKLRQRLVKNDWKADAAQHGDMMHKKREKLTLL